MNVRLAAINVLVDRFYGVPPKKVPPKRRTKRRATLTVQAPAEEVRGAP